MSTYAHREAAQQQRQQQIQAVLKNNQHTLVQMNSDEFIDFMFHIQLLKGKNREQVVEWVDDVFAKKTVVSKEWEQYKTSIKTTTGMIPLGLDALALGALALEMQRGGNVFEKYQIKTYNGKPNVIFKGYSGLRSHLTGTKYLANNPKVVSFGIGKLGAAKAIKGGFITTVIISATFHSFEQMLNDKSTWHDFVGGLTVDVGIAAVASGIAWGAVSTYVGGAAAMVAVGPLLAVVVVGAALTVLAAAFIDSDALSKRISDGLREAEQRLKEGLLEIEYKINRLERIYDADPIGFMHRLFGIPYYGNRY
ncbi:hypothetical protein NBRC116592_20460 [Colwellia sp. KU-HH00111]|uniref:hypothetical protein n=1 Tax=Colwellia sp. KU-HH00111 TaxID=3127652 RepID=UPI0031061D60